MEFVRPPLAASLLATLALASAGWAQGPEMAAPHPAPRKAAGPIGLPGIVEPAPEPLPHNQPTDEPAEHAPAAQQPASPPKPMAPATAEAVDRPETLAPPVAYTAALSEPASPSSPQTAPDPRRLAPRSHAPEPQASGERPKLLSFSWDSLPFDPVTSAAALGLVVGLFMLTAALLKRATPKSQRLLPGEVASVVGRIPLGGKQTAHLLKVGSKLVLVHITPEGAKPLTEVTDPAEVSRLLGLCEQEGEHSSSTAFRDVFEKLTSEPTEPGFLGGESPLIDRQQLAAAYANTPGGRGAR